MALFQNYHMTPFETPDARAKAADLPVAERQILIETMLLPTPTFQATVDFLRSQHMPVTGGRHSRGRICGILGPSRVGKSWAVKAYCASLGEVEGKAAIMPKAVYLDCKKGWSALVFAQAMADAAQVPRKGRASAAAILELVSADIAAHGVELVVVDDAQWMFTNWTSSDIAKGFLIGLAERRSCNVVLAGTEPISLVVRTEESMYGRGMFPTHRLKPSPWREGAKPGEFHLALDLVDDLLPFRKRSGLANAVTAAHLYHIASGKLGLAMEIVAAAANMAIETEAATIDVAHLRAAAQVRRLPGDPWEPFRTAIDISNPGVVETRYDEQDNDAEEEIAAVLGSEKPRAKRRPRTERPPPTLNKLHKQQGLRRTAR